MLLDYQITRLSYCTYCTYCAYEYILFCFVFEIEFYDISSTRKRFRTVFQSEILMGFYECMYEMN